MKKLTYLLCLVLIISAFGCVFAPFRKLTNQSNRVEMTNFSVMPPQGKGWYILSEKDSHLCYANSLSKTHSFVTEVYVFMLKPEWKTPGQFLEMVKQVKYADKDSERFELKEQEFTLDPLFGTHCVKYRMKLLDKKPILGTKSEPVILDIHGYAFLHTMKIGQFYDVFYSERYRAGEENKEMEMIGDNFIRSFQFK